MPVQRPLVELPSTISPYWLAGFITGLFHRSGVVFL